MPYTEGLLDATPRLDGVGRLRPIPGRPPIAAGPTVACRFAPRCIRAAPECRENAPALRLIGEGHRAACHFAA
jgi:oligopeptide/dipeptide ABC transporter ATP-binding protein